MDLAVEGSLGNWAKFISLDIPSLSFGRGELPGALGGLFSTSTNLGILQGF